MTGDPGGPPTEVVDLAGLAQEERSRGAAWALRSPDLDANLVVFGAGEGVGAHVNAEVDVLLVGVAGEGVVEVDGRSHPLRAGQLLLVPKGARRATRAVADRFAYLSCHRRRAGLLPSGPRRPAAPPGAADPTSAP